MKHAHPLEKSVPAKALARNPHVSLSARHKCATTLFRPHFTRLCHYVCRSPHAQALGCPSCLAPGHKIRFVGAVLCVLWEARFAIRSIARGSQDIRSLCECRGVHGLIFQKRQARGCENISSAG